MFLPAICDSYFLKQSYLSLKLGTIKNIWKHKPAFFECKNYIDSIEIKNYKALKNKLKIITNEYQNGIIATMLLLYIAIIKQQKPDFELNIDKKVNFYDPAIAIYKSLVSANFITAIKMFKKIETIIQNKKFICTNCKQNHIQYEIICKKCNHMGKIEINTFENEKLNLKLKGE